eukprot:6174745-Pleurochrysis_carterae.AAC.2
MHAFVRPAQLTRSYIDTSHGAMPAAKKAAAISRSPLDPSCRMTATRGAVSAIVACGAEETGEKVSARSGAWRVLIADCSCLTHSGLHCSISRAKLVASQTSRSAGISAASITLFDEAEITVIAFFSVEIPMRVHGTPASANAASTADSCSDET